MPYDHPDYKRADKKFIQDAWNCLKAINKNLTDDDITLLMTKVINE